MEVVVEAGHDPARTIMSHLDRTVVDDADLVRLGESGCYLEFDLFGQESSFYPLSSIDMPNDATRVDHLMHLIEAGYGERLLVAQDICRKTSLTSYGGEGYGHILTNVLPLMRCAPPEPPGRRRLARALSPAIPRGPDPGSV